MLPKLSVEQSLMKASSFVKKDKFAEAQKLYQAVLLAFPQNIRAQKGLAALNKAIPNNLNESPPKAIMDQLINLYNQGQLSAVVEQAKTLTEQYPETFTIWNILGASTAQMGMLDEAIEYYKKSISLKPDYANAYNNMGNALKDQGKLDEAIEAYKKSIILKPTHVITYNMANALKDQGKLDEAIDTYNKAILLKPDYAAAYNNMGNALKDQGKFNEAIDVYKKALSFKPDYPEAYRNIGLALKDLGKLEEAIEAFNKAILLKPDFAEAYNNIGNILNDQGDTEVAIDKFKQALKIRPDYETALVNKLLNQAHICDWDGIEEDRKSIPTIGISDEYFNPGHLMSLEDEPERHRMRSELYAKNTIKQRPIKMPAVPTKKPKRLRIGYFSSDFRAHSVIYMIADILDAHDRDRFEIYGYSFGPDDNSKIRNRIINTVDIFHDVKEMADQDIALLARQDKIDIAIDLNGYTENNRSAIFAYRAAPIQIHFWGSANSSGANFIDYYITNNIAVPEEHDHHYSESLIRLPFWCQARHDNNYISDYVMTRKDVGLPEQGFVFCSFNNSFKLSPTEFDIWMRLLNQVEGSVLWLLKTNKWFQKNLQEEARKRGVAADRLVFAKRVLHPEHLARQRLADVFVDSFNVNAGATAGDALWVGLPVVTKLGKGLAARTGSMILASIDMPELITKTEQEYEALLLDLATNPQRLSAIKEKLAANRLSTPLFNSELFTKYLENGYQQAYQRYFDHKDPMAFSVSAMPT